MTKRTRSRIFPRTQGGAAPRYYARFADFSDVGAPEMEALTLPGKTWATTDAAVAEALCAKKVEEYQRRRLRAVHELPPETALGSFAARHLVLKSQSGRVTDQWCAATEGHLKRIVAFLGDATLLETIDVPKVRALLAHLGTLKGRGGRALSGASLRQHLNTLSNLLNRAAEEGLVTRNVVSLMSDKPRGRPGETRWLEVYDAALLLEAARLYRPTRSPKGGRVASPFAYELIATALLTGGRPSEVLGLQVDDVSLDRDTVTFRPNEWRRLKTLTSHRTVPLWPQLREILERYLAERPPSRLLFPSFRSGKEAIQRDARKLIDAAAVHAGWTERELNLYTFRHSYCAARLQSLDGGAPVSPYTVAKELGHGGDAMVRKVYGHLGQVRHRAPVVEYRVEQHEAKLGDRLAAVRSGV